MPINARQISLLLAISVAIVTTMGCLALIASISNYSLFVIFFLSFSSSYLFFFIVVEFWIFREIHKINEVIEKKRFFIF